MRQTKTPFDNSLNNILKEDEELKKIAEEEKRKQKERRKLWSLVGLIILLLGTTIFFAFFDNPKPIESSVEINSNTGLPFVAIYKDIPLWLNPFFALTILSVIIIIIVSGYLYFRISLRNRTNVIIHMPDGKRQFYSYKKFSGKVFKIKGFEKDKDNNFIYYNYYFRPEALETGYFGSYIEYDYGILEPLNPRSRGRLSPSNIPEIFRFVSSLLNTQLAVDLLLSQAFKDFVKMALIIIGIEVLVAILIGGYQIYQTQQTSGIVQCILTNSTQNSEIIRNSLR